VTGSKLARSTFLKDRCRAARQPIGTLAHYCFI